MTNFGFIRLVYK